MTSLANMFMPPHTPRPTADPDIQHQGRAPVVVLCGSIRFRDDFHRLNHELTLAGRIVLAPGVFAYADGTELTPKQKAHLDDLHLQKIDLADVVMVVNPGGYIGESTRRQIAYAQRTGKPVDYLTSPASNEDARDATTDIPAPGKG